MGKVTVSKKNKYYLPKDRYLELLYFVKQLHFYEERVKELEEDIPNIRHYMLYSDLGTRGEHMANMDLHDKVMEKLKYESYISAINVAARDTDFLLGPVVLKGIISGQSYGVLNAKEQMPCCRNTYYALRREFFWRLDKALK